MCVLSDYNLLKLGQAGKLTDPFVPANIQPNSLDVRLGELVKYSNIPSDFVYDMRNNHYDGIDYIEHDLTKGDLILPARRFCLGVTLEVVKVPQLLYGTCSLTAKIEGRSGVGRTGLCVVNAGRVDTGWDGRLTLELYNSEQFPIVLFYGMPIAQVVYETTESKVQIPYGSRQLGSKYQGDTKPEPSKMWRNYQEQEQTQPQPNKY